LTSLIKQIVSPTTNATKVQIAATEKAIATIHSQMFVSFSFILFDYSVAIIPRFNSVPAVMALRVEARRFTRLYRL